MRVNLDIMPSVSLVLFFLLFYFSYVNVGITGPCT